MAEEIDDNKLIQAYRYWHDCGFDEDYSIGYEDGYETGLRDRGEKASMNLDEEAKSAGAVQRDTLDQ